MMIFLLCLFDLLTCHNALRDKFVHPCAVVMCSVGRLDRAVLHTVQGVGVDTRSEVDMTECSGKADRRPDAVHGDGKRRDRCWQDAVTHPEDET